MKPPSYIGSKCRIPKAMLSKEDMKAIGNEMYASSGNPIMSDWLRGEYAKSKARQKKNKRRAWIVFWVVIIILIGII